MGPSIPRADRPALTTAPRRLLGRAYAAGLPHRVRHMERGTRRPGAGDRKSGTTMPLSCGHVGRPIVQVTFGSPCDRGSGDRYLVHHFSEVRGRGYEARHQIGSLYSICGRLSG